MRCPLPWCGLVDLACSRCHQRRRRFVCINTLRSWQNSRHFPDDIYKCLFSNEHASIAIKISLNCVPRGPINYIRALAWRRPGDKPLSETMMGSLPTHICVTRTQWVESQRWSNLRLSGVPARCQAFVCRQRNHNKQPICWNQSVIFVLVEKLFFINSVTYWGRWLTFCAQGPWVSLWVYRIRSGKRQMFQWFYLGPAVSKYFHT